MVRYDFWKIVFYIVTDSTIIPVVFLALLSLILRPDVLCCASLPVWKTRQIFSNLKFFNLFKNLCKFNFLYVYKP